MQLANIRYWSSMADKNLIPRAPMLRVVKKMSHEVCQKRNIKPVRYRKEAADVLHDAAEHYMTQMFEGVGILAAHAGRVTADHRDVRCLHHVLYSQGAPNCYLELMGLSSNSDADVMMPQSRAQSGSRRAPNAVEQDPREGILVDEDLFGQEDARVKELKRTVAMEKREAATRAKRRTAMKEAEKNK